MKRHYTYTVDAGYDGSSVQDFLKRKYNYSTNIIKSLKGFDDGILKNGERAYTVHSVKSGDVIDINIHEKASENIIPRKIDFDIVYEDEDLLVICKNAGIPTHPSMDNYENSVANGVMYYFKEKGEDISFHAVNRLDRDTSGLMVIAKNAYVHSRFSDMLHTQEFIRRYRGIVHGILDDAGTVDVPIKRKEGSAIERVAAEDGQRAVTHYKRIMAAKDFSAAEIVLETGRTHQIRVHMAYIGHPLAGDFLYGKEEKDIAPRQMLHSAYISFIHPITGERMEFESDFPDDMRKMLKKFI